jgi:hypothetical protein
MESIDIFYHGVPQGKPLTGFNPGYVLAALLRSTTPSVLPARKVTSSPEAQALAAGLLRGLGEKYQDEAMSAAGEGLQRHVLSGFVLPTGKPSAGVKPKPGRNRSKARNKNKRRRK